MNGTPFKLATIARVNKSTKPFAALVLGDEAIDLSAVHTVRSLVRTNKARRRTYAASPSPPVGSKTIRVALENKKT